MMKKFLVLFLAASSIFANALENKEDATQKYRNKKAYEAIIHDAYYEAQPYDKQLPEAWKDALTKFGYKEDEVNFYTAVRMNKFTERVGNNIVILRPNFFLYLNEAEQVAYIGLKLASLQAGDEFEVGGSHETFYNPKVSSFKAWSFGALAVGLVALYHEQIIKKSRAHWPTVSNILFSKAAALVAGIFAVNGVKKALEERENIKKLSSAQYAVIDKLGSEGILTIREKQAHWGSRKNWLVNKWFNLLGKLSLAYNPETDLEAIKEYIAKKNRQ